MRINKYIVLALILFVLLSILALSQIEISDPDSYSESKFTNVNDKIEVEEKQDCYVSFYNSTQDVYGYVTRVRDTYGTCFNPANQSNYTCVTGTEEYQNYEITGTIPVVKNTTNCRPRSFVVSVNGERKEIDFYGWGVCIQEVENNCLAVICGTLSGGSAWNGQFIGCDNGKSCQKFLFCEDGTTKALYKASREDFVEEDPTFQLTKLELKGVGR